MFYTIAVLAAFAFEREIAPGTKLSLVTAGFIAATELLSIYENVTKVTSLDIGAYLRGALSNFAGKKKGGV